MENVLMKNEPKQSAEAGCSGSCRRASDLEGLMELDRLEIRRLEERLEALEGPLEETDIQLRLQCQKLFAYGTTGIIILAMLMSVYTSDS